MFNTHCICLIYLSIEHNKKTYTVTLNHAIVLVLHISNWSLLGMFCVFLEMFKYERKTSLFYAVFRWCLLFRPYSIRKWSLRRRQIPVLMPSICHKNTEVWLWNTKNKITLHREITHYFAPVRFAFLYFIINAAILQITNIQTNTSTLFLQLWRSTLYCYLLDNWNDRKSVFDFKLRLVAYKKVVRWTQAYNNEVRAGKCGMVSPLKVHVYYRKYVMCFVKQYVEDNYCNANNSTVYKSF